MNQSETISESDLTPLINDTLLQTTVFLDTTDSTNSHAIELLAAGTPINTPLLVYAESQQAGRGRGGNQWWSSVGSLTFSVVIDFHELGLSDEQKPLLPLVTGIAILRTGQKILPSGDFKLKWPNDIFLAGRKLAGILIEVPSQSSNRAVVGVGLNVNNPFSNAPESLQEIGTSLAEHSRSRHDRVEVLRLFLQNLEAVLRAIQAGQNILADWSSHCLLTDHHVTLRTGSTQVTGLCQGVNDEGALMLETRQGLQSFFGGVVKSWT